jgi:hypothetical protein
MRVDVPFEVHYLTPGTVPIEDVIDALLSAKRLIEEGGYNLGDLVPGLHIEQVSVTVRSITQESPLPRDAVCGYLSHRSIGPQKRGPSNV